MKKPTAVDLFSGAGGLTEGLKQAGFSVIGAVEIDALACRSYRLNHKRVRLWACDITSLPATTMMRALGLKHGELDLLAACPPCQGFSRMRTKNGKRKIRDARNNLVLDVLRFVRCFKPKCVMLENVPGLVNSRRFSTLRRTLKRLGYKVKWEVLDTADFGVPQRRRRLVLLGTRKREGAFAPKDPELRTVREFLGSLPAPSRSADSLHNYKRQLTRKVKDLIRRIPKNGGGRAALGSKKQLKCHQNVSGFRDVYGRMAWNKQSPTITGGCINPSKGRFIHPTANRPITLREAALLQTFPQNYRISMDRGWFPAALLIGNALPPEFIRRHARALRRTAL